MYNFRDALIDDGDYLDKAISQGYGSLYALDLLPAPEEIEEMLRSDPEYDAWDNSLEEDVPL